MIFLVDRDGWNVAVKSGKNGILIIDRHLLDEEGREWHWVKDMGERHLLGKVELNYPVMTSISEIDNQQVLSVHSPSRYALKRMLLPFAPLWKKEVEAITVAKFRVVELERYWCSGCGSVNLEYLKKALHDDQLPFRCFNCELEFYTKDLDEGSPRVKNATLEGRYCKENVKKIPLDQEAVVAVIGEQY